MYISACIRIEYVIHNAGFTYNVIAAPDVDCPTDVIFVMDQSGSIRQDNFDLMKSFLSQLIDRLDIDGGNTRVGVITYNTSVGTGFNLSDHLSVSSVRSAIMSLTYEGGGTMTAVALRYVRTTMLTSEAGDRPNIPNVVVVLTDGQSQNITATKVSIRFKRFCLIHWRTKCGNIII